MAAFVFFKKHWWCFVIVIIAIFVGTQVAEWTGGGSATPVFRRVRFFNASDEPIPKVKVLEVSVPQQPKTLVTLGPIEANRMGSADADSNGFFADGMAVKNATMLSIVITVTVDGVEKDLPAVPLAAGTGSFGCVAACIEKNPDPRKWDVLAVGYYAAYEEHELMRVPSAPVPIPLMAP